MAQLAPTLSLVELCHHTGESERTLRYWIQFGLLSGPAEKGPAARYPMEHVALVAWIRDRQAEGVPLKAILVEVERQARDAALRARTLAAAEPAHPHRPHGSAGSQGGAGPGGQNLSAIQEYLARANLLTHRSNGSEQAPLPRSLPLQPSLPLQTSLPPLPSLPLPPSLPMPLPLLPPLPSGPSARQSGGEWNPPRTRWDHLLLDDGVELLVKRPLDTWRQRKVEKLLRYAATLFANSAAHSTESDAGSDSDSSI